MRTRFINCLILSLTLCGCVGPMTPFGALNGLKRVITELEPTADAATRPSPKIRFTPKRQVLHDQSPIKFVIEDTQPIPPNSRIQVIYNGIDVSEQFLAHAQFRYLDPEQRQLEVSGRSLRLLPTRDNDVRVTYQRKPNDWRFVVPYEQPDCRSRDSKKNIEHLGRFDVSPNILTLINAFADEHRLNPNYIAALIAQESAFNPKAVSTARALGLTQVTSLGEAEIIKQYQNWPRYPGIAEMSPLTMKLAIYRGAINGRNEWRLNPEYSIQGGIEYLNYLTNYWGRSEKQKLLPYMASDRERDRLLTQVILASYNSGAARVSDAIARNGTLWLKDRELNEANRYVRRIFSYCDYFSQRSEE